MNTIITGVDVLAQMQPGVGYTAAKLAYRMGVKAADLRGSIGQLLWSRQISTTGMNNDRRYWLAGTQPQAQQTRRDNVFDRSTLTGGEEAKQRFRENCMLMGRRS